ncbi:endocuticle structural glycoprotein SgAbd-2-like [Lycorma delicatula]|uniref:endocuticle structural glycoprotein SgAbd-2-like n=1 Tax=Lycorma delicatula TaxID=130591 RepID=UPI003F50E160
MLLLLFLSSVMMSSIISSTPQHSYSSLNSLFRRGSPQPVYAAHPTQLPFVQTQQHRQYQQNQYQFQQQNEQREQTYQEEQQQEQQKPVFRATAEGLNPPKDVVPIIAYSNDLTHDGTYSYNYETGDGMSRQESGVMTNPGTPEEAQSVTGSYSYTAPDGTLIEVNYIADANGFRAEGAHLPTPPPIPNAILRSLEYIAAKQREAPKQQDQYEQLQRTYRKSRRHQK